MEPKTDDDARKPESGQNFEQNNGFDNQHDGPEKDFNSDDNLELVLQYLQEFQDTLISGGLSFRQYESVSEYSNCDNLRVLPPHKWKGMSLSDIATQLSVVNEYLIHFMSNILDKMSTMDGTVVRVRSDNERLNDRILKLTHNDRNNYGSLTLHNKNSKNQRDTTDEDYRELKKKVKTLESRLKDRIEEEDSLQLKNNSLKNQNKKIKTEMIKLNETIEELLEKDANENVLKEIKVVQKQLKELTTNSKMNGDEITTEKHDFEKIVSKICEKNTNRIIDYSREIESMEVTYFEKSFSEMKKLRTEMELLKDITRQGLSENERKSFEELKQKELELLEEIKKYKSADIAMKNAIQHLKEKFECSTNKEIHNNEEIEKYKNVIADLTKELDELKVVKEDNEKKMTAITIMKEKISKLTVLATNAEKVNEMQSKLDQSNLDQEKLRSTIASLNCIAKESKTECENLKKDNLRLEKELENMKKLNLTKKSGK